MSGYGEPVSKILCRDSDPGHYLFNCPGCKMVHQINTDPKLNEPCWQFNGNADKPTFKPSLRVRYDHWIDDKSKPGGGYTVQDVCHSFITDGNIQFLNDCTHELAGKTVPIPEW